MYIKNLELSCFRNHEKKKTAFCENINIICGENGRGKTNIVEGIYMLTGRRSWRAAAKRELVTFGHERGLVCGDIFSERDKKIELPLPLGKPKVNGVAVANGELSLHFGCVLFCPEDMGMIKSGSALRRDFIDSALCQLRPKYSSLISRYEKVLQSKSRALKMLEEKPGLKDTLTEYSEQLIALSAAIIPYRAGFIERLSPLCERFYSEITGGRESMSIKYKTVSSVSGYTDRPSLISELREHMILHSAAELAAKTCLSGVHKDDLDININYTAAKSFASQGQTRSAALALKFAERQFFFEDRGSYPVLLLDDVLSELDARRQEYILNHTFEGQTIITCCEAGERFSGASNVVNV